MLVWSMTVYDCLLTASTCLVYRIQSVVGLLCLLPSITRQKNTEFLFHL